MSALDSPWRGVVTQVHGIGRSPFDEADMAIVYITLEDQNANVGMTRLGQVGVAMPVTDAPVPHIVLDDVPVIGEAT